MLVIRLWNYFRGYVIIKVEGLTLESFINMSISKGIYLWDIERIDYTTITAKISIKGFKELRDVIKKVGCRIHIINKTGFPFFIYKFKFRKMLAIGFLISIACLIYFTSYIWSIEIIGEDDIPKSTIENKLKTVGVDIGTKKDLININDVKVTLLNNIDSLSFVKVEIKGTKLIIEAKKRNNPMENVNKHIPCSIVSDKQAVIVKILAKTGKALVKKGDVVEENQILITGKIEDERFEKPLLVHAEGEIIARTTYSKVIKEKIKGTIKEETGNVFSYKEIIIGNKKIQLINGDIPFKNYEDIIINNSLLGNKLKFLPVKIIKHELREVKIKEVVYNINDLKVKSIEKGKKILMEEIGKSLKIVSTDEKHTVENNILTTKITIEILENIGQKKKITTKED